ncbi:MAG: alcohol dehydrogenase catalytic domain-containing protein [Gammaproteobacteria bacterium]|nr:alcohol dehydrogenase catalytic domain-containing protein [Gammaproteobacteria bacterium]
MSTQVLAAVLVDQEKLELRELPLPPIGDDDGLLRIEACGICGTDISQFRGELAWGHGYPVIPGHEIVGRIEKVGRNAARRWNVEEGDLVAVDPFLPCGCCDTCLSGRYANCTNNWGDKQQSYGFIGAARAPALWGGYARYLYLHRNALLHRFPPGMPPGLAVLFNVLGGGIRWAVTVPKLGIGDTIVIMTPGQRGLTSVIAAREAGAGKIIVTGRKDSYKMALARELGADVTINVQRENLVERLREETGGQLADVVLDLTPDATQPVLDAIEIVRPGGTIVLAGSKGGRTVALPTDTLMWKDITLRGVVGVGHREYRQAIKIIASGKYPLHRLVTHRFPLHEAEAAIRMLAGEAPEEEPMCIAIEPWLKERLTLKGAAK